MFAKRGAGAARGGMALACAHRSRRSSRVGINKRLALANAHMAQYGYVRAISWRKQQRQRHGEIAATSLYLEGRKTKNRRHKSGCSISMATSRRSAYGVWPVQRFAPWRISSAAVATARHGESERIVSIARPQAERIRKGIAWRLARRRRHERRAWQRGGGGSRQAA